MRELKIFKNPEFGSVRTVEIDGEPWLVGKDVAKILGYTDAYGALKKHVDDEDRQNCQNDSFETPRGMTVINESGLYSLVIGSKLPSAKKFKRWVTSEVLPSIRKHGMYAEEELLDNPDLLIKVAQALKEEREKNKKLSEENKRMKPKEIFADAVSVSSTSILIGELAKIIKQNGVNIGQNRLFIWMRENGYLISRKGTDYNMPMQKSMDMGLFEIKERTINNPDGSVRITKTVLVTGKGQQYFINKFLGK
jgi:Prophage antirepressor